MSLLDTAARRCRQWFSVGTTELASFSLDELELIARDLNLSIGDLRELVDHESESADLLFQRMAAVGLESKEFALTELSALRDMQRVCTLCNSKVLCAGELRGEATGSAAQRWRDFCPNAASLAALVERK